jgi:transposase
MPPSVREWLPPNHLVFLVEDVIDQLDLSAVYAAYSDDGRGGKVFSPRMMLWLMLYAWCRGIHSSRAIARLAIEDVGGRIIVGDDAPNFRTVNLFRLRVGDALKSLFVQSVRLCMEAKLVSLEHLGIDGTKLRANASLAKSNSFKVLDKQEARLEAEIDALLERSRHLDESEDELYGPGEAGPAVSPDLADRQKRREILRQAKEALKQRAVAKEHDHKERWEAAPPPDRPHVKKPLNNPEDAAASQTDQYNFVDPDSRVLKQVDGSVIQGYNAQIAVDGDNQIIVAVDGDNQIIVAAKLTNAANDSLQLIPLLDQAIENTEFIPRTALADKGYYSRRNLEQAQHRNVRPCIPPPKTVKLGPLNDADKLFYKKRSSIVEPVFGQIKGNRRSAGFRAFLRRGLQKCNQEWLALCTAHNICKYIQYGLRSAV